MASEYALNLKATIDTSDMQSAIDRLNSAQSGTQSSSTGAISGLQNSITSLQRTIQTLNQAMSRNAASVVGNNANGINSAAINGLNTSIVNLTRVVAVISSNLSNLRNSSNTTTDSLLLSNGLFSRSHGGLNREQKAAVDGYFNTLKQMTDVINNGSTTVFGFGAPNETSDAIDEFRRLQQDLVITRRYAVNALGGSSERLFREIQDREYPYWQERYLDKLEKQQREDSKRGLNLRKMAFLVGGQYVIDPLAQTAQNIADIIAGSENDYNSNSGIKNTINGFGSLFRGGATGALIGSMVPGIGTTAGAIIGASISAIEQFTTAILESKKKIEDAYKTYDDMFNEAELDYWRTNYNPSRQNESFTQQYQKETPVWQTSTFRSTIDDLLGVYHRESKRLDDDFISKYAMMSSNFSLSTSDISYPNGNNTVSSVTQFQKVENPKPIYYPADPVYISGTGKLRPFPQYENYIRNLNWDYSKYDNTPYGKFMRYYDAVSHQEEANYNQGFVNAWMGLQNYRVNGPTSKIIDPFDVDLQRIYRNVSNISALEDLKKNGFTNINNNALNSDVIDLLQRGKETIQNGPSREEAQERLKKQQDVYHELTERIRSYRDLITQQRNGEVDEYITDDHINSLKKQLDIAKKNIAQTRKIIEIIDEKDKELKDEIEMGEQLTAAEDSWRDQLKKEEFEKTLNEAWKDLRQQTIYDKTKTDYIRGLDTNVDQVKTLNVVDALSNIKSTNTEKLNSILKSRNFVLDWIDTTFNNDDTFAGDPIGWIKNSIDVNGKRGTMEDMLTMFTENVVNPTMEEYNKTVERLRNFHIYDDASYADFQELQQKRNELDKKLDFQRNISLRLASGAFGELPWIFQDATAKGNEISKLTAIGGFGYTMTNKDDHLRTIPSQLDKMTQIQQQIKDKFDEINPGTVYQ